MSPGSKPRSNSTHRSGAQASALTSPVRHVGTRKRSYRALRTTRTWVILHALVIGIIASATVHAALMLLKFSVPEIKLSKQQDRGLEIVLVNAKHARAPKNAQALAQANLDGGGNVDQKALPSSPLPPEESVKEGDALMETRRRVQQLEEQQRELLTRAKSLANASVNRDTRPEQTPTETTDTSRVDLKDQQRAIARQEAIIERQLREYAQRPRKQFIGARTQEYRFAQYVESWRSKIEKVGTLNYPKLANKQRYGSLLVSVEIRHDGSIIRSEIQRSSGSRALDEHALRILQISAPFPPFPADIRKDTDVLVITRTWTFLHEKLTAEQ